MSWTRINMPSPMTWDYHGCHNRFQTWNIRSRKQILFQKSELIIFHLERNSYERIFTITLLIVVSCKRSINPRVLTYNYKIHNTSISYHYTFKWPLRLSFHYIGSNCFLSQCLKHTHLQSRNLVHSFLSVFLIHNLIIKA